MTMPKKQIDRTGRVVFADACMNVWEEGISDARKSGGMAGADSWEKQFKRDVFARIVQQLNRLGWTCKVPPEMIKSYGYRFATKSRDCHKGELKGHLDVSGRCIRFEMWQGVNTPTRPDHGGRYESNKEAIMPYLLRLEMERTRRRIRDYLCNVFAGYEFCPPKIASANPDPLAYFNGTWESHRFARGADGWPTEKEIGSWSRKDADGNLLSHGDVRYFRNYTGHLMRGRVYGGINGMWLVVYGPGRRDFTHKSAFELFNCDPARTPRKVHPNRRRRIQELLSDAVNSEDFLRAAALKRVRDGEVAHV